MPKQLTDTEIAMRIVPTLMRWPPPEIAKTIALDKMREAVGLLRTLMRTVDDGCLQAEQDNDLSSDGIARRRQALGLQAIAELANWPPLQAAERAVTADIKLIESKMTDLPQPPANVIEEMRAQELRSFIRTQKSPIDFVMKALPNRSVLAAVLHSPAPILAGLSEVQMDVVRERARTALHPEQQEMQKHLAKAVNDVRQGIDAARRLVCERCDLRLDDDSQARPVRSPLPLPKPTLVAG